MSRSRFVLMLSVAVIPLIAGPAHAKSSARSYSIKCAGEDDLQRLAGLAGIIKFTDATHALGTVFLNISDGTIVTQQSFTATVVNGTAAADGTGGNSIPTGCFTAAITIGGDTFGVFGGLFGCYSKNKDGFNAVQNSGPQITCEAESM